MKIKEKIRQGIFETIIILMVASVSGVIFNHFNSKGISLIARTQKAAPIVNTRAIRQSDNFSEPAFISLEQAVALFENKTAIFVDARKPEHYEYGHIPGARLISWTGLEKPPEIPADLHPKQLIVVYCSDPGCEMAAELAFFLFENGYSRLRIFEGGWEAWRLTNLPTEKGIHQ